MSNPHAGEIPFFPTILQTVFFSEGSAAAIVVTNKNGRRTERKMKIKSAEDALAWAKKRQAGMVYLPAAARIDQN